MKTAELFKRLIELDPTQETEVLIGNHDILALHKEPAYYDGSAQVLIRDPSKAPYYDVVGAKIKRSGTKICLIEHSIKDMLYDHPDYPVEVEGESKLYESDVKRWREEAIAEKAEVDRDVERMLQRADDAGRQLSFGFQ